MNIAKDRSLNSLLRQQALRALGFYTGALDNIWGPKSEAAYREWLKSFLVGDGTWGWYARVVGPDIVIDNASMTWFGGDNDPLDNGETASGIKTKGHPDLLGVALPVISGHASTKGSPLAFGAPSLHPSIPWGTVVEIVNKDGGIMHAPLIDNGPSESASDPIDGTVKLFTSLGGKLKDGVIYGLTVRIIGAAQFIV